MKEGFPSRPCRVKRQLNERQHESSDVRMDHQVSISVAARLTGRLLSILVVATGVTAQGLQGIRLRSLHFHAPMIPALTDSCLLGSSVSPYPGTGRSLLLAHALSDAGRQR